MRAGLLRNRLDVQAPDVRHDTFGQQTKSWTTIATVWGAVEPLRGNERFEAQTVAAQVSHKVRMRYDKSLDVTAKHRLLFGTRIFHIEAVMNLAERNRTLELLCREEV